MSIGRLLFFSNNFPTPWQPGRGPFNRRLVQALARTQLVRVVTPVSWTEELAAVRRGRRLIDRGEAAWIDGVRVEYPRFYYPPKVLHHQYGRFMEWSVGEKLDGVIREFRPDAVLAYWAHPDGEVAVQAAHRAGIPAVVMTGGSDVLLLTREEKRRQAIGRVLNEADAVIAVSNDIAHAVESLGVDESRVHVVRRGVDREVFNSGDRREARRRLGLPESQPIVVSVGRLVPVKGFAVLIDACRQLLQSGHSLASYVIGDGPERGELQREIEEMQLQKTVHLVGSQRPDQLADWYRAADCLVVPSLSEGVPNVLLEAMSCNLPFVASAVGGIPEVADPEWDRLMEPGDARQLAEAIRSRLSCPQPTEPRRFMPGSWDESAADVWSVVQSCLRKNESAEGDLMSESLRGVSSREVSVS